MDTKNPARGRALCNSLILLARDTGFEPVTFGGGHLGIAKDLGPFSEERVGGKIEEVCS